MSVEVKGLTKLRGVVADVLEAKGSVVYAIGPRDSVYDAVVKMNDCRVGALLVMDGEALVGIVSERDYTRKVAILGRSSKETRVDEIMSSRLVTVEPRTSLSECLHLVNRNAIRHLPVLDGSQVAGVISIGDLVLAVLAQQQEAIENLSSFIGSDYPH